MDFNSKLDTERGYIWSLIYASEEICECNEHTMLKVHEGAISIGDVWSLRYTYKQSCNYNTAS